LNRVHTGYQKVTHTPKQQVLVNPWYLDVLQPDIEPVVHKANLPDIGQKMENLLFKCDKMHTFIDIRQKKIWYD